MSSDLVSRVALVTGGGRGIGRAIATLLAAHGARVVIADLDGAAGEATVAEINGAGGESLAVVSDVSDPESCAAMVRAAVERFGRLDIQVNNAGISHPTPALELTPARWNQLMGVNLSGVFFSSQAAARQMVAQAGGAIISIASIYAAGGLPERAPYCAAKAGVVALTQALACEWAPAGIRVNAVAPGYVQTDLVAANIRRGVLDAAAIARRTPLGRIGTPEQVAEAVLWLASDRASYVTGETLFVDGGWRAYAGW